VSPFVVLATVALLAFILSACGSGGSSSSSTFASTVTGAPSFPSSTTTSSTTAKSAKKASTRAGKSVSHFGSIATGVPAHRAEVALSAYFAALSASDWSTACSYLTAPIRRLRASFARARHEGKTCAAGLRVSVERLVESRPVLLAKPGVSSVRTEGDRGFVLYDQAGGPEGAMPIRSEGGAWKLAPLDPVGVPVSSK
jgi:hypothetical protein